MGGPGASEFLATARYARRGLHLWIAVGVLALPVAPGGCVATQSSVAARGVVVNGPPPAPIAELQRPAAPSGRAVWVAGYWHWTGMQYAWIPGHWDENAPPGAAWAAPRYVSADGAYYYEAGGWKPVGTPPAQGRATANALR